MQARANELVRLQDPYFALNGCQYVKELTDPFPFYFTTNARYGPAGKWGPAGSLLGRRIFSPEFPLFFSSDTIPRRVSTSGFPGVPILRLWGSAYTHEVPILRTDHPSPVQEQRL